MTLTTTERPRTPSVDADDHRRVLPNSDGLVTAVIGLAWLVSTVWFWTWWLSAEHWVTPMGLYLTSLVILVTFSFGAWYLTFSLRKRPKTPTTLDPGLRLAAVVTKAPSEPWPVVQRTLQALLDQDYPHSFDVWLADEDPSAETLQWCMTNDVRLSSRKDVSAYHQATWPRRTRCKEGNLAYFYDNWGYDLYDVVAQFDADHVPEQSYLRTVAPYFNDPAVGYVAAPSMCDIGSETSWMARGRLYREATFHGSLQMSTDGLAPSCIGSHYVVRTAAIASIGGIGPELAEDFSTTFLLVSAGWEGRFAPDALAHGEGPETFADGIRQEMQWSRSLVVLLLDQTRGHWTGIAWAKRIRLGFSLFYYPIFVAQMVFGVLFAPIALISDVPWVDVALGEYLIRAGLPAGCLLALVIHQKARGRLRPSDAPILSWEAPLFHVIRWPWVGVGLLQALVGKITNRTLQFAVTPKGTSGPKPLSLLPVSVYAGISFASSLIVILAGTPERASGYFIIALVQATTYAVLALVIPLLHLRENSGLPWHALSSHVSMAIVAIEVMLMGVVIQWDSVGRALRSSAFLPVPHPDANLTEVLASFVAMPSVRLYLFGLVALGVWATIHARRRVTREQRALMRTEHPTAIDRSTNDRGIVTRTGPPRRTTVLVSPTTNRGHVAQRSRLRQTSALGASYMGE